MDIIEILLFMYANNVPGTGNTTITPPLENQFGNILRNFATETTTTEPACVNVQSKK